MTAMEKIDNQVQHKPEIGQYGDCHRVCVAMVLGVPVDDVPHFYEGGDDECRKLQQTRIDDFLKARGLCEVVIPFQGEMSEVIAAMQHHSPNAAYILGGTSGHPLGNGHSIVCAKGTIWHDPTGSGITGPMADGFYWVTVFAALPGYWRDNAAL